MKKRFWIAILCCVLAAAAVFGIYSDKINRYKERYFSEKDSYAQVADMLVSYYTTAGLHGNISIWAQAGEASVFHYESESDHITAVSIPQNVLDEICALLSDTGHEYVSIDGDFVEFGNSTGSLFIYFSISGEKPEKISRHHNMLPFGGGWYFSKSMTL